MSIHFTKMHGAGNDFVVIDNRAGTHAITAPWARKLADRRLGIGCDQLVVLEGADKADIRMRIYNHDGSEVAACGNASRCIGWWMMEETGKDSVSIQTAAGVLQATRADAWEITVDMGEPRWEAAEIPLSESRNTLHLGLQDGALMDPVAINMGNPHMVFFVPSLDIIDIARHGPKLEKHPLFPERCNVSVVQVMDRDTLRMKVWERGTGETLACGTAACAAVVAGVRRELCNRRAQVTLPGGTLTIDWQQETDRVRMTGPVALVYRGEFSESLAA